MAMKIRDSWKWEFGRTGEILQYGMWLGFGCGLQDLSDRTRDRAPLIHDATTTLIAPDTNAIRTAEFGLEFKTKSKHEIWRGGGPDDDPKINARMEEGIDTAKFHQYTAFQQRWRKPLVLSILSLDPPELIAGTLDELSKTARVSTHPHYPFTNWDVRSFTRLATFNGEVLSRFFDQQNERSSMIRKRWLERSPTYDEVHAILKYLQPAQPEFEGFQQHLFDVTERNWHRAP